MIPDGEAERKDGWRHLVTGDESWFFLLFGPRQTWILAKDEMPRKTRTDIKSKRFMFAIMRNSHGSHVIDQAPTDAEINATYYTTKILQPLHQTSFP
jgi:hypothetical protein